MDGRPPTCLAALDVQVATDRQGQGIAAHALTALRGCALQRGLQRLVVPVRPTTKQYQPRQSIREFLARRRADGLSEDPWLRTHERLGARMVKIAPFAMTITGSGRQWREWTDVTLADGANIIEGALAPVLCSTELDLGIYVEPNVWFEHPLSA